MIWVPILYICLSNTCGFVQGEPTYSKNGCQEQLSQASVRLQQDPDVKAFDATCVLVRAT